MGKIPFAYVTADIIARIESVFNRDFFGGLILGAEVLWHLDIIRQALLH